MNERQGGKAPAKNLAGFVLIAVPSVVVAVLLVLAVPYYAGASARISGLYTSLAAPADRALAANVEGYRLSRHRNLAAARLYLLRQAQAETSFDDQLGAITFPPAADRRADLLIAADQKRIKLIRSQVSARTLRQLQSFDAGDASASAAVEAQVAIIRRDLGLPAAGQGLY
jgi:hypothetical protein